MALQAIKMIYIYMYVFFCVSEILARERGMPPSHKIIYMYMYLMKYILIQNIPLGVIWLILLLPTSITSSEIRIFCVLETLRTEDKYFNWNKSCLNCYIWICKRMRVFQNQKSTETRMQT